MQTIWHSKWEFMKKFQQLKIYFGVPLSFFLSSFFPFSFCFQSWGLFFSSVCYSLISSRKWQLVSAVSTILHLDLILWKLLKTLNYNHFQRISLVDASIFSSVTNNLGIPVPLIRKYINRRMMARTNFVRYYY